MTEPIIFDAQWLMRQVYEPIKFVIPGILPEGMGLLIAAPKVGKSWLVLDLALSLSVGGLAFGHLPVGKPRPVLYLALEDGPRRLQDRLRQLDPPEISHRLEFMTSVQGLSVIGTIRDYIQKHAGLDPVVILDTLGKVMPPAGNQSQYGHDYATLSALKATCDAVPGSSLVIVHHTRKAEGGDFLDAVSGTQGIAGAADSILLLKRDRHEKRATLQVTSRDALEGEYSLTQIETGAWQLDGSSLDDASRNAQTAKLSAGVGDRMADVLQKVGEHPEGLKAHDLATLLDLDDKTAAVYLTRAYDAGRVDRPRRGLYTPVMSVGSVISTLQPNTNNTHNTPLRLVETEQPA